MTASFGVGAVLHWKNFEFPDGSQKNKFFVVLGARSGQHSLVVIATSKRKNKDYNAGCHPREGYYHIPGARKDFFTEDTWLLLMECQVIDSAKIIGLGMSGALTVAGQLRIDLANAIRNCLKQIQDVSQAQLSLL